DLAVPPSHPGLLGRARGDAWGGGRARAGALNRPSLRLFRPGYRGDRGRGGRVKVEGWSAAAGLKDAQALFEVDHARVEAQGHLDGDVDQRQESDSERDGFRPIAIAAANEWH